MNIQKKIVLVGMLVSFGGMVTAGEAFDYGMAGNKSNIGNIRG